MCTLTMRQSIIQRGLKKYCPQLLAATAATTMMLEMGIMSGWSSPYLARLESPNSTLPLTPEQGSWIVSLMSSGRVIGSFIGLVSVNKFGSKCTLLLACVPILCSWIFIICAQSAALLYVARLSGGVCLGMTYCSLSLYVGEVALPEIRGAIVSAAVAGGTSVGIVLSSIYGSYLPMSISATMYSVPCVLVLMLLVWLPESPHWLVKINDYEGARRSIVWYQPTIDPDVELSVVKKLVASSTAETFRQKLRRCVEPGPIREALVLVVVLFVFMQLAGMGNVIFHMQQIFAHNKLTMIEPSIMVVYVNTASVLATIFSMYLIDEYGRKFLMTLSCSGIFASMSGLGVSAYLADMDYDNLAVQWLTVVSVFSFMASFFVGMMSVPNTILGEMFPSDVKSVGAFVATLAAATWSFICTKSFQPLVDLLGEAYVFWIHGTFALVLIPYVQLRMLETKGKSLAQIQDELMIR